MSIKTFFQGIGESIAEAWDHFWDWLGSKEIAVIQEGKTIIDELVPVVKAELLADGSEAFERAKEQLLSGVDPLDAIKDAASFLWKEVVKDGRDISKAASTAAGAFLIAKVKELISK